MHETKSSNTLFSKKTVIGAAAAVSAMVFYGNEHINHKYDKTYTTQTYTADTQSIATQNNQINAYFTPQDNCERKIINVIDSAKKQILIQAYGFTSVGIGEALTRALSRGVVVRILLDKSNAKAVAHQPVTAQDYSTLKILKKIQKAEIVIDHAPGIAHNKIIIADDVVITGSFNFTTSAQQRNAENIIILYNAQIAQIYQKNWDLRYKRAITGKQSLTTAKHNKRDHADSLDNNDTFFG